MRRVVVVGAGVAGTAAALSAARNGSQVTVVAGPPGASTLAGGAKDEVPWESDAASRALGDLDACSVRVLEALGDLRMANRRALVVATTGLVRPARAVDAALLDVGAIGEGVVAVVDGEHGSWDAEALSRAWSASPRAKAAGVRFEPCPATLVRRAEELSFPDIDMAHLHDDDERVDWLGARVREAVAGRGVAGVVLPPWLGVARERASALALRVGVPCGEALSAVGGPSGLRFEHARNRAFATAGVVVVAGRAGRVEAHDGPTSGGPWRVWLDDGASLEGDAVILAMGGLVGGGFAYTPASAYAAEAIPEGPRPVFTLACEAPVVFGARGVPLTEPSSLFGGAPETETWPYVADPLLDHAGILVDHGGRVVGAPAGLFATGELAADLPRTWLAALGHGARAGEAAAV